MGQSASMPPRSEPGRRSRTSSAARRVFSDCEDSDPAAAAASPMADRDSSLDLPDECLAIVFQSLGPADRNNCSLVCKRWLSIEGQSRHRISLDARAALLEAIPTLFSRFDSVTKLALKCDRGSDSIGDEALALISARCPNLTRLKIRACREVSEVGMTSLAKNCPRLRKLSCGYCIFGSKGINAVLAHCPLLEELSIKRLRGDTEEPVGGGDGDAAFPALKTICLKELYDGHCYGPLITGSPNLRTLKLFRCSGDWDKLFVELPKLVPGLVEVHLERLNISDRGLSALSSCADLEVLHLVRTTECTNAGLAVVAERCRRLRKIHIDGGKANRIGDEGLAAVARRCSNLQELVLIGVNPTALSLGLIAGNCRNLERLALCGSETIGDAEISCIASKCLALKKLCIKGCPVSNHGMEALAGGCPNLVKVKVKKCKAVTAEAADWLRTIRASLAVNLDVGAAAIQVPQRLDAGPGGALGSDPGTVPPEQPVRDVGLPAIGGGGSRSSASAAAPRSRWRLLSSSNLVAATFRRVSKHGGGGGSSQHSL
ncbi:F-box protein At1g47056-like [Wolffia australiana]